MWLKYNNFNSPLFPKHGRTFMLGNNLLMSPICSCSCGITLYLIVPHKFYIQRDKFIERKKIQNYQTKHGKQHFISNEHNTQIASIEIKKEAIFCCNTFLPICPPSKFHSNYNFVHLTSINKYFYFFCSHLVSFLFYYFSHFYFIFLVFIFYFLFSLLYSFLVFICLVNYLFLFLTFIFFIFLGFSFFIW